MYIFIEIKSTISYKLWKGRDSNKGLNYGQEFF